MKRAKVSSAIFGLMGVAALLLVASTPAKAAFVVGGENGWQMSYDGMINVFMVYDAKDQRQYKDGTVVSELLMLASLVNCQSFRIRTGLLPSIFAFNVKSPTIDGVDYAARIGLYPQIQNNRVLALVSDLEAVEILVPAGPRLDIREVFFTADGKFGQFLVGRALNLYEGKNILTDMTLIGNGVPLNMTGGGVDLGHIGYGYTYTSFGPQFRYTTPDMAGAKIACCHGLATRAQIDGATTINQPRFETELSYVKDFGGVKISSWLAGLYQEAKFNTTEHKVSSHRRRWWCSGLDGTC